MNTCNRPPNNRILVIDDNASIQDDIRKILSHNRPEEDDLFEGPPAAGEFDFQVDAASQGEEGLGKIQAAAKARRPYAMAFVDVCMPPGWDGIETITRIWQQFPDMQVVICTGYSDTSWEERVRKMTKSDNLLILKKPFETIEVLQLARALTQKWTLSREVSSEQKQLQNQLQQARKMEAVGQLAAGVAHDFNNILTVVQGNASLLLTAKAPESDERKPLQSICAAAEKAGRLVRQLLAFSRQQPVELRPSNLREILATVSDILPRILTERVKVALHAPPGLPDISADCAMLETLLMNLAFNARDAMPEGGQLRITAEAVELDAASVSTNPEAQRRTIHPPDGERHGHGHTAGGDAEDIRAVFYDQARGQRHRPGTGHGLRHSQATPRLGGGPQRG